MLLCATSGGADSLCLLWMLAKLYQPLLAIHCNHGLRPEADTEERRLERFCGARGIAFRAFRSRIKAGPGLEARARQWRRRCYALAAKEVGARYVFLAHHAGDQAETLLLHLMRGAGLRGALAMHENSPLEGSRVRLLRPWLQQDPAQFRQILRHAKIRWSEDKSNRELGPLRNRLRLQVMPLMEKMLPGATLHLAAFPERLKRRALPGLESKAMQRVEALLRQGHGEVPLGSGKQLRLSRGRLRLQTPLQIERRKVLANWAPEPNAFWISNVALEKDLGLRGAKAGDRFRPFGMKGSRLVFDVLAESGIPSWERAGWPLLVDQKEDTIFGILGVRQAEEGRLAPTTRQALRVSWPAFDRAKSL